MTDSSSFSSLLALADSHLSKTDLLGSRSEDDNRIYIPPLTGPEGGTLSETRLSFSPGQRIPVPKLTLSESPIQSVLAEQVANMLRAKEQRKQQEEEKQRLAEKMKEMKLEEDDCVIDLMQALLVPGEPGPSLKEETKSSSSSFESLFEPKFIDCDEAEETKPLEPLLPCKTDMSYIVFQRVKKGKCSAFGKVLTSKLRPVAAPYLKEDIECNIVRFDFKTQSPCDIIKERQRKPSSYNTYACNIFSVI